jgi:hypothetical protein
MWAFVNRATTAAFEGISWPASRLSEPLQLAWLGLLAALLALLVFRFTSDQDALGRARDRVRAHLLELWIYRDDLGVSARAQAHLLRQNLAYLRHTLVPLLVMLGPFVLLLVQIEARFAWRPLAPEEAALLTVDLADERAPRDVRAELAGGAGLRAETPPLRTPGRVVLRVRPLAQGRNAAPVRVDGALVEAVIIAGAPGDRPRLAPSRYRATDPRILLYPGAEPLAAQADVSALHVEYPRRGAHFAGLSAASWIWLGFSLLFALVLRRPLGVQF